MLKIITDNVVTTRNNGLKNICVIATWFYEITHVCTGEMKLCLSVYFH